MKEIQKTLLTYAKPETDIVWVGIKGKLCQDTLENTFDTFSGGGSDTPIGPDPDTSEDDNRTNKINVWDTL